MSTDDTQAFPSGSRPPDDKQANDLEQRLDETIAAYLKAAQAGQAPSQQEWLARHPDLAPQLAEFFADRERVERLAEPVRAVVTGGPPIGSRVRYIGDYELLEELGRGGMGVVYKAQQTKLRRLVAVKMILSGDHAGEKELARFRSEGEAVARLQHPNIVQIFEVGEYEGHPYFSLEYCVGGSLEKKLQGTPLPPMKAAGLVETLAKAMHAAHQAGVVHRDLKPANILLTADGTPKITDFGLAKKLDDAAGPTGSGTIMGTPSYMAPEQAEGKSKEIGPAADVYALGAILYEMLTGRPPFKAATVLDTVLQVVNDEPVPPRRLQTKLPRDLETICLKCLQKSPRKRYADAASLAEDLRRFQAGEPIQARPAGYWERGIKWAKRRPTSAALVAVSLLAAACLTLGGALFMARLQAQRDIARMEEARAEEQQVLAEENGRSAQRQRTIAEDNERSARHNLYASQLALAQTAWRDTDINRFREILDGLRPGPGQEDLRGFEWYYLWRLGHSDLLTVPANTHQFGQVAFSPDGKRLATGGGDIDNPNNVVKLWDVATGKELLAYKGQPETNTGLAFSPDGQRIASACGFHDDSSVKVWDAATGNDVFTLKGPFGRFTRVVFSPDGKRLATGSSGTVKVWNATDGKELLTFPGDSQGVTVVSFIADGQRIASYSDDNGIVKVRDAATGNEVLSLDLPTLDPQKRSYNISKAAFEPNGSLLAVAFYGDNDIVLWDLTAKKIIHTLHGHTNPPGCLAFSADGKRLASAGPYNPGGADKSVKTWDVQSGEQLFSFKGHSEAITSVVFSPDGSRIATGSWDRTVKVWDATTGQEARTLPYRPLSLAFSPDGHFLALGHPPEDSPSSKLLTIINVATGQPLFTRDGFNDLGGLVFSPDGHFLAGHDRGINQEHYSESKVLVWQATTGEQVCTFQNANVSFRCLVFSPDSKRLFGLPVEGSPVKVWDVNLGRELPSLGESPLGKLPGPLAEAGGVFSPDGQMVAFSTWTEDGTRRLTVWEAATSRKNFAFEEKKPPFFGMVFSADGKRLATSTIKALGDQEAVITVWEAATGKEIFRLRGHSGMVQNLAFSPDGKRLATSSSNVIKLWDMASGQELLTLRTPSAINCLAFSPDGNTLVSGGQVQKLIIWDATPIAEVQGRDQPNGKAAPVAAGNR